MINKKKIKTLYTLALYRENTEVTVVQIKVKQKLQNQKNTTKNLNLNVWNWTGPNTKFKKQRIYKICSSLCNPEPLDLIETIHFAWWYSLSQNRSSCSFQHGKFNFEKDYPFCDFTTNIR